jgi:hypothetical protein
VAALVVAGGLAVAHAEAPGPSCEVRKAGGVSFRSATARDVLEVSVGPGPCATARLSIMIRSDGGRVLYDYAQGFAQHVVYTDQDPLHLQAVPFVDRLIADGVEMSDRLPPWQAPDAYEAEHLAMILIDRAAYERLRQVARPLFSHPTYHEGWRSVVWDEARGKSVTVVEGGS